jgi:hypothetical protein
MIAKSNLTHLLYQILDPNYKLYILLMISQNIQVV